MQMSQLNFVKFIVPQIMEIIHCKYLLIVC